MRLPVLLAVALLLGSPPMAAAQEHAHGSAGSARAAIGELTVSEAWAKATLPNQKTAAAYLAVANAGTEADRLLSASSPAAGRVEIHSMSVVDDVMTMRPVPDGLEVPAGGAVALAPGDGYHLMLMDLSAPLVRGSQLPLTLTFERAGQVELSLPVQDASARGDGHADHGG